MTPACRRGGPRPPKCKPEIMTEQQSHVALNETAFKLNNKSFRDDIKSLIAFKCAFVFILLFISSLIAQFFIIYAFL